MTRLIDAKALANNLIQGHTFQDTCTFGEVLWAICHALTIDAVEVVRCWECKNDATNQCPYHVGKFGYCNDDFCSNGERRKP